VEGLSCGKTGTQEVRDSVLKINLSKGHEKSTFESNTARENPLARTTANIEKKRNSGGRPEKEKREDLGPQRGKRPYFEAP